MNFLFSFTRKTTYVFDFRCVYSIYVNRERERTKLEDDLHRLLFGKEFRLRIVHFDISLSIIIVLFFCFSCFFDTPLDRENTLALQLCFFCMAVTYCCCCCFFSSFENQTQRSSSPLTISQRQPQKKDIC